jgi:hypothetical protein
MWSTTPVPLMPSSSSPRYKQIVIVGIGKPERDDNVEISSGVLGGFIFHRIVVAGGSPRRGAEWPARRRHMSDGVWLLW